MNKPVSKYFQLGSLFILVALLLSACSGPAILPVAAVEPDNTVAGQAITLKTGMVDGRMAFIGEDGTVNPEIHLQPGESITVTLVNGDGILHDVTFPDFNAASEQIS
ncbi:MAG TPA: hypothetical protein VHO48_07315, partial [Anaerolineaceae bacterium]|nr:hypothetical protein [Anaerolineaceae bacterium]